MERIERALEVLNTEASDIGVGSYVQELCAVPDALEFATSFLSKNTPAVFRGAISHWPALQKWTPEYLQERVGEKGVHVAITPNGLADGLARDAKGQDHFVLPLEQEMTMREFLCALKERKESAVYYIQHQNSNFLEEFPELLPDIDLSSLQFAAQAFGQQPDAINFWMGDERAVSSMHKDPYENLYCVVAGHKDFILIPPHQLAYVPRKRFPTGIYARNELGELEIAPVLVDGLVRQQEWVAIDPLQPDVTRFPAYKRATPIEVRVRAGDLLYLPNYWFHHVRQSHGCIAVNFWYDMDYDSRYAYYRMLETLTAD